MMMTTPSRPPRRASRFERIDELLCVNAASTASARELLAPSPSRSPRAEQLVKKNLPVVFGSPWMRPLELDAGRQARRAAWSGDATRLSQLHRQYPCAILACDERDGSTPAHWACLGGHAAILQVLLLLGCDVEDLNTTDAKRQTPLHWAAMHGHRACVEALLEHDDPHGSGVTWLQRKDHRGRNPAHWAARNGHVELLELMQRHHAGQPRIQAAVLESCDWSGRNALQSLPRTQDGVRTPTTPAPPPTRAASSTPSTPTAAAWVQVDGSWQSPTTEARRAVLSDCRQLLSEVEQLLTPQPPTSSPRGWSASTRSHCPPSLPYRWTEAAELELKEQKRAARVKRREAKVAKAKVVQAEEYRRKQKQRDRELQEARVTHVANKRAAQEQAEADKIAQMEREQKARADAEARATRLVKEQDEKRVGQAQTRMAKAEEERQAVQRRITEQAATRIAAAQRGRQARARVRSIYKKLEDLEVFIGVEDADSFLSDQAADRRPLQKSSLDQAVSEERPHNWALTALDNISGLLDMEESAAAKIQAVHRGRLIRAALKHKAEQQ